MLMKFDLPALSDVRSYDATKRLRRHPARAEPLQRTREACAAREVSTATGEDAQRTEGDGEGQEEVNTATNVIQMRPSRLLPLRAVTDRTGLSKTSIYRLESQGKFPRRVSLTPSRVAWVEHEIDAYIADRIAARDGGTNGGTHAAHHVKNTEYSR